MTLSLDVPRSPRMLPPEQMPRAARAKAAWLALQAGFPVDFETWALDESSSMVVVDVPGVGHTWGVVKLPAEEMLAEIERHFGKAARERAERAVGA